MHTPLQRWYGTVSYGDDDASRAANACGVAVLARTRTEARNAVMAHPTIAKAFPGHNPRGLAIEIMPLR